VQITEDDQFTSEGGDTLYPLSPSKSFTDVRYLMFSLGPVYLSCSTEQVFRIERVANLFLFLSNNGECIVAANTPHYRTGDKMDDFPCSPNYERYADLKST